MMSDNLQESLRETLQDIVNAGLKTTFTDKRLKELGVEVKDEYEFQNADQGKFYRQEKFFKNK